MTEGIEHCSNGLLKEILRKMEKNCGIVGYDGDRMGIELDKDYKYP